MKRNFTKTNVMMPLFEEDTKNVDKCDEECGQAWTKNVDKRGHGS